MASGRAEPAGLRGVCRGQVTELLRLAYVLTGDQHAAEDLLQSALTKAAAHWGRIPARPRVTCGASFTASRSAGGGAVPGGPR